MTETSCCLDSHPKFFCSIGASIFGLQAHIIQQTFSWSRKFQRQFHLYWQILSHFLLYSEEHLADVFMKQEPWRTISPLGKFSSHLSVGTTCPVKQSRQEQFLAQMSSKLHKESLWYPSSSWSSWCCQEQTCLIVMKSPKFLNILNAIFWRSLKDLKNTYLTEIIFIHLENITWLQPWLSLMIIY